MRGVVCALCLFAGGVFATPIATHQGVAYRLSIILPCRSGPMQLGVTELEELNAATGLAEGRLSPDEFLRTLIETDPAWAKKVVELHAFAQSCHDIMRTTAAGA